MIVDKINAVPYHEIRQIAADRLEKDLKEISDQYETEFQEASLSRFRDPISPEATSYRVAMLLSEAVGRMVRELRTLTVEERLEQLEKSLK